jgi:putative membrane protein (TIGR04086 family)
MKQIKTGGNPNLSGGSNLIVIIRAIIFSYIVTIPIFIIFALILAYTNFPEKLIVPVVVVTTIISVLTAAFSVTRKAETRGWLNGGIVGFIYMFILYILSSIVYDNFTINKYVLTMVLIGVLTGAIGGMLGINSKLSYRSRTRRRQYKNI